MLNSGWEKSCGSESSPGGSDDIEGSRAKH